MNAFYEKVQKDELIGHYFAHVDWNSHLPKMYNFWSSLLFLTGSYKGFPFAAHQGLQGLSKPHFDRWINLFNQTLEENFSGENATIIKNKADQIAAVFRIRLGVFDKS